MRRTLIMLFAILLVLPLLASISFTANPQFNSGNLVFTDDTLTCTWAYSFDATAQNISIFREGVLFNNSYETGSPLNTSISVNSVNTTKNEDWECVIELDNGTATVTNGVNITIQNRAPETPTIYNASDADIGVAYTVIEDTTYTFDVNSSDLDNDTLRYYFKTSTFCTMISEPIGNASCTPEQSDLINGNETNVSIVFWVDDDDSLFAKSASKTVTFTVIPSNDVPTAVMVNQTTLVNESLTYIIDATDEEDNFPLLFALLNTPAEISPKVSLETVDNDTIRFIYNASPPDFNDVNTTGWLLTLNITDSDNASSLMYFNLNITAVGRAPQIINYTATRPLVGGRYILDQGENITIFLTANDSDENDRHVYRDNHVQTYFNTTTLVAYVNQSPVGNTSGKVNFTATNDDVGQFSVTITVKDIELITDTIQLNFTVNNVNDAPNLYDLSTDTNNTNSNTNLSNITSYAGAPLYFAVNASDIDTQYGDVLNYSDNSTLFDINNITGVISFTPDVADVQLTPYSINITVIDNESLQASKIISFYILNNTAPYFTSTPPNMSCAEGILCTYNVSQYSTDDDAGDSVVSYTFSTNLTSLSINSTTGFINFTPNQSEIGNYSVQFIIADSRGATNTTNVTFEINNTEETPVFVRYDFSGATIVETFLFTYQLQAQDNDLLANVSENLTFTSNLTFGTIDTYITASSQTAATLSFRPNSSHVGTHSVNLTVTDVTNLTNTQIFTFTILEDTEPPAIKFVQPYPNATGNTPVESYNITPQLNPSTLVFAENNTYFFAHVTTDDTTAIGDLTTIWYYDSVSVSSNWSYTRAFNFSSSGTHTLLLEVNDTTLESTNFTWTLIIADYNRRPLLLNNLSDVDNVTGIFSIADYFKHNFTNNSLITFIDPDDDLNENNVLDNGEVNNLVFTAKICVSGTTTIATLAISGDDLVVTPKNLGFCNVIFTATDGIAPAIQSNSVLINVTKQPDGAEETVIDSNSGSGGGSTSRSSFIPLTKETEKPEAINIIAPRLVTVYENNSVIIPFEVKNNWKDRLDFIQLSSSSNTTEIITSLSSNFIESLEPNETTEIILEIKNYRLGNNYEIELIANVSSPSFEDTAIVILTSIEQSSDGDNVDVKVTFARDLFNDHPECQELNELLDKANEKLQEGNFDEARRYVDTAINGCKYIVSTLQQRTERPDAIPSVITLKEATLSTILFTALAFLILSTIAFIIYYHYTSKEEDDI